MQLIVDKVQRFAKMRSHTAAHLLNAQLDKILWWTKQAWSYVEEDYLRFDFTTDKPLTKEQIKEIELNINSLIWQWLIVTKQEMSFDDAIKFWAKAFFEDKYWDNVRVISVWENNEYVSIELCGWTHADNTKDIWAFKIVWQEAVASGIRRVVAVTGPKVAEYAINQDDFMESLAVKFKSSVKQLPDILEKLNKDYDALKAEYESIQDKIISAELLSLKPTAKSNDKFDYIIDISSNEELERWNFKNIVNKAKEIFSKENYMIYKQDWSYALYCWKQDYSLKDYSQSNWIKGWGSEYFFQWKDPKVLEIASNY